MPPTALATSGRPFHIASVTVSPNPSGRLFWTTTSARRCTALTISAFSFTSSMAPGPGAPFPLSRLPVRPPVDASREHLRALRVVGYTLESGADQEQVRVGYPRGDVLGEGHH